MLQRCLVVLIVAGLLEPALACDIEVPPPRELKVETVQGLGGDCYYKRIPPLTRPDDVWEQDKYWRTEFYVSKDSVKPAFTRNYYFQSEIACLENANGDKSITTVDFNFYPENVSAEGWYRFFVNDQLVKSYSAIDVIQKEENSITYYVVCDPPVFTDVSLNQGFIFSEIENRYVYEVVNLDRHVVHFDLLTGELIPVVQSLDALLTDALVDNNANVVKDLLAQGVDPNQGNIIDGAPLYIAVKNNNAEMARMLLLAGADAIVQDAYYDTDYDEEQNAIYTAAKNGNLELVQLLWGFGANVNHLMRLDSQSFQSPLDVAVLNNYIEIVQYLLERGANFSDKTLELAKSSGNAEMIELVSSHTPR